MEPGEEQGWRGSTGGEESLTDREGSFTGPQEDREDSTDPQKGQKSSTGPQEQYYSSSNRKKPLTDFGQSWTCNACRQRNRRAKNTRRTKYKVSYIPPKVTQAQLQYCLQALSKRNEFTLRLYTGSKTRPLIVENYLNK